MIHLDTHVLVWLLGGDAARLPDGVRRLLDSEPLAISPMVELELVYLHEVGRLRLSAPEVLDELRPALELVVSTAPFAQVVTHATGLTWTRDPFDRLIAATALADGVDLLTADALMRQHLSCARWPA